MTEQLMDNLSNEEHEALLLMSEHAIAPPLSPAAQAVLDAFLGAPLCAEVKLAAALRASAKPFDWTWNADMCHKHLHNIAAELENIDG